MPNDVRIKNIKIKAFRGIPEMNQEVNKRGLIILGENGTGKSSFVEALEFFFKGTVSSFQKIQGISLKKNLTHVNFQPSELVVELTFSPTLVLKRTLNAEPIGPTSGNFANYYKTANEKTFALRRSDLLKFINSRPKERLETIGSILGIESLDATELVLKKIGEKYEAEYDDIVEKREKTQKELEELLGSSIDNDTELANAINRLRERLHLAPISSLEDISGIEKISGDGKGEYQKNEKYTQLEQVLDKTNKIPPLEDIDEGIKRLNEKFESTETPHELDELEMEILERGKDYIREKKAPVCPLCEQPIKYRNLIERLDERINVYRQLSSQASDVRTTGFRLTSHILSLTEAFNELNLKMRDFKEFEEDRVKITNISQTLQKLEKSIQKTTELKEKVPDFNIEEIKCAINGIQQTIKEKGSTLKKTFQMTEEEKLRIENAIKLGKCSERTKNLLDLRKMEQIHSKNLPALKKLFTVFSDIKKQKIQTILDSIQQDINNFYEYIHPKDAHRNLKLEIDPKKRASADLWIDAYGKKEEDPRAYISEGHLDSLGLCLFLAFVKNFNQECSLIILDDVVNTVDKKHRGRICKLLLEKFPDKQLILTTHDENWYRNWRRSLDAYKLTNDFANIHITDWTLETGPEVHKYKSMWEDIQKKLQAGDKIGAGSEGRTYFELILKKLCEITSAPVPFRKDGKYEVETLFNSIDARLKKLIRPGDFLDKINNIILEINRTKDLANLLSHENSELVGELSIDEIREFCELVHTFNQAFKCPACNTLFQYSPELHILGCGKENCTDPFQVRTT